MMWFIRCLLWVNGLGGREKGVERSEMGQGIGNWVGGGLGA